MRRFIVSAAVFWVLIPFFQPVNGRTLPYPPEERSRWEENSLQGIFRKAYYSRDDHCRIYLFKNGKALLILTQTPTSDKKILKEGIRIGINEESEPIFQTDYYIIDENGEKSIVLKEKPDLFKQYVEQTEQAEGLPKEIKAILAFFYNPK